MRLAEPRSRRQFRIRALLMAMTYLALVLGVCVQHQRASIRWREVQEQRLANGLLPLVGARKRSAPPASRLTHLPAAKTPPPAAAINSLK